MTVTGPMALHNCQNITGMPIKHLSHKFVFNFLLKDENNFPGMIIN